MEGPAGRCTKLSEPQKMLKPKDFGVDDGALQIEEYETHIDVKPLRKLDLRELSRVSCVVNRHNGKRAGVCDYGIWFSIPIKDHSENVDQRWIEVRNLVDPPFLVRGIDEEAVGKIVASIKKTGRILEALVARPNPKQVGLYELVIGVQRLEAAKRCGWTRVRCDIYPDLSEEEVIEWQFVENEARSGLTDYQRGRAMDMLMRMFPDSYETEDDVGLRFGLDQRTVSQLILHYRHIESLKEKFDPKTLQKVMRLGEGVTRELRQAPEEAQCDLLAKAAEGGISVRVAAGMAQAGTSTAGLSKDEKFKREQERAVNLQSDGKTKKDALVRKLGNQYSESMTKDIVSWCEAKDVSEKILLGLFPALAGAAWANLRESGRMEETLEETLDKLLEEAKVADAL